MTKNSFIREIIFRDNISIVGICGICDRINLFLSSRKIEEEKNKHFKYYWILNPALKCDFKKIFTSNINVDNSIPDNNSYKVIGISGYDYTDFEKYFSPSEEVYNLKEKYKNNNWDNKVLGVHVRIGDKKLWHVPIESYFEEIEKIYIENCKIFLCSDEQEVFEKFNKRYKNVISYPVRKLDRISEEGIIDAATCLFLLRETNGVIGWGQSGFSLLGGWDVGLNLVKSDKEYKNQDGKNIITNRIKEDFFR